MTFITKSAIIVNPAAHLLYTRVIKAPNNKIKTTKCIYVMQTIAYIKVVC